MARRNRQKKSPVAAVCSVLGTLLLIIIVAAYLPITIPRAFGYEIYTVISGSMEPAIPTGSLVYVKYIQPEEIQTEDVIAFYGTDADGSIALIVWYPTVRLWVILSRRAMPTVIMT